MEQQNRSEYIDLREVFGKILSKKKSFFKVWGITFVLACAWILPIPRSYDAEVVLAPESVESSSVGTLGSLASTFGFNIGSIGGNDALYPLLYPDLMSSNDFMVSLLDIQVSTDDGSLTTDYLTYLTQHQKVAFYRWPLIWLNRLKKKIFPPKHSGGSVDGKIDPFYLSYEEDQLLKAMKDMITCSVDKKTDVITIRVTDQDPLVCATIADSVRVRLQNFITEYRTSKARIDKDYYERLVEEAHTEYERSMARYGRYCDTHRDIILQSMLSERDALENDMQLKYQTYQAMSTQLEAAKAKVQESTPAFTVLQGASVPVKAAHPKRMLFVLGMLILVTIGYMLYILRDELKKTIS